MKQIILGTAGHIDHGKTSLIKAVTGTDTDRLKEEKERGITIELGFAALDLPSGQHLGIVDVPGHEKFVKNMVAGATGIDIVVMVIAADEGVMPQTREHMEICSLLGIRHGFVALTKIDLVDEEWLELAQEDVREFAVGTFLEDAPIIPVSSTKKEGLKEFVRVLDELSAKVPERPRSNLFRLPVDRVFSMKGFGTVITGSLLSGQVGAGDTIMIYSNGITSKVRGVQVHNRSVEKAQAGQRTAINFQGLEKTAIERGATLAFPGTLTPSHMVDVSLLYLKSNRKALKNRTRVRLHTGTSEVLGNLIVLDREEIKPGESTVVQLRLDAPVSLIKDDRYVIRSYSPVRTIGGGKVLNPMPPKHKRFRRDIIDGLNRIDALSPEELVAFCVDRTGYRGASFNDLVVMTNIVDKPLEQLTQALLSRKQIIQVDKESRLFMHANIFAELKQNLHQILDSYHKANPLRIGIQKEELRSKIPSTLNAKIFTLLLNQMIKDEEIAAEEDTVRLFTHKISLGADQQDLRKRILSEYNRSELQPPWFKELSGELKAKPARANDVLRLLVEEGQLVKVKEDLYFDAGAVKDLQERLVEFLTKNGEISTPQFKEMTGATRKYVIPLIEYFDARNVTIRIGDIRKLRKSS